MVLIRRDVAALECADSSTRRGRAALTGNRRHAQLVRCVLFVLCYGVLANVPFWVASHWLGVIQNGCFGLSYALVGVLALFLTRIPAAMLLLFAMPVDVVAGVCLTYYPSLGECLDNFRVLGWLSRTGHAAIATVLGLTILIVIASSLLGASTIRGIARRSIDLLVVGATGCQATFSAGSMADALQERLSCLGSLQSVGSRCIRHPSCGVREVLSAAVDGEVTFLCA
jgi:hypothetical protein